MTRTQIRDAIINGWPFFGTTPEGEVLARYVMFGPVFHWRRNQMIPMPLQGSDLLWWLQVSGEEHGAASDSDN
ncbi:MAG: hypothetical protein LBE81_00510 [Azonexus sp.]|jgi:hypothetical protein|uniref:hypothetical protein n=1 Tax=Azonexus sp. TaxID=1872668 RepID=UPI00283A8105|nr:hypothetical protein [Azonexus sp.]MDR0775111.1 hypothetical protein [Azonexus sp.]